MLCFLWRSLRRLCRFWDGRHKWRGPRIGVRGPTIHDYDWTQQTPSQSKTMRRCLQQRRTLGHRNISSRFLVTSAAQAPWRHAVEQKNASVNALVYVVPDDAGPVSEGPLNGMTVAVKDNICTKNMPTTCSSAMLRGNCSRYSRTRDDKQTLRHPARLPITLRRDRRTPADSLGRDARRQDKLRRVRHGVRAPI
jgi:hypothetical protein